MYSILDRNDLMALYSPVPRGSGTLLADARSSGRSRRTAPISVARSQSPDQEEPERDRRRDGSERGDLMIPPPSLFGIAEPISDESGQMARAASTTRRTAWHPTPVDPNEVEKRSHDRTEPTNLEMDPATDNDRFGPISHNSHDMENPGSLEDSELATESAPKAIAPSKSRWRLVKVPSAEPVDSAGQR